MGEERKGSNTGTALPDIMFLFDSWAPRGVLLAGKNSASFYRDGQVRVRVLLCTGRAFRLVLFCVCTLACVDLWDITPS